MDIPALSCPNLLECAALGCTSFVLVASSFAQTVPTFDSPERFVERLVSPSASAGTNAGEEALRSGQAVRVRVRPSADDIRYEPRSEWMFVRFAHGRYVEERHLLFASSVQGRSLVVAARDTVLRAENEYSCFTSRLSGYYEDYFMLPSSEGERVAQEVVVEYELELETLELQAIGSRDALLPVRVLEVVFVQPSTERVLSRLSPHLAEEHVSRYRLEQARNAASGMPRRRSSVPFHPPMLVDSPSVLRGRVEAVVEPSGRVGFACVATLNDNRYAAALLDWVAESDYEPARVQGRPVPRLIEVPVEVPLRR